MKRETASSTFSPILIISTMGSVCTVGNDGYGEKLVFSFGRFAFSCFLTLVAIVHLCFIPILIISIEKSHRDQITNITIFKETVEEEETSEHFIAKLSNPAIVSTTGILARLTTLFQMHKHLPRIIAKLQKINDVLNLPRHVIRKDVVAFRIMIALLLIVSFPFQWTSIISFANGLITYLCLFLFNNYNNFTMAVCELQFIALCYLIYTRFKYVNEQLAELDGDGKGRWWHKQPEIVFQNGMAPRLDLNKCVDLLLNNRHVSMAAGNFNAGRQRKITKVNPADTISTLNRSYRYLCDVCDSLNSAYNFQLLLSLGSCTVNLLLNIYFAMFGGFRKTANRDKEATQSVVDILNSAVWSSYYFLRFVFVVLFAAVTAKEASDTKMLVLNLLHGDIDESCKNELWVFVSNTVIREVRFKACGFFTLNLSLIFAAVTTCTTYLVIMAQFHGN